MVWTVFHLVACHTPEETAIALSKQTSKRNMAARPHQHLRLVRTDRYLHLGRLQVQTTSPRLAQDRGTYIRPRLLIPQESHPTTRYRGSTAAIQLVMASLNLNYRLFAHFNFPSLKRGTIERSLYLLDFFFRISLRSFVIHLL